MKDIGKINYLLIFAQFFLHNKWHLIKYFISRILSIHYIDKTIAAYTSQKVTRKRKDKGIIKVNLKEHLNITEFCGA